MPAAEARGGRTSPGAVASAGARPRGRTALRRHGHGCRWPAPWSPTQLLLLDEPFAALDEITRAPWPTTCYLWAASKPAIVFVTH